MLEPSRSGGAGDGFWGFLGRWLWLLAAGLILGAVIGVAFSGAQRALGGGKTYESRTMLQVRFSTGPTGDIVTSGSDLDNARLVVGERVEDPRYLALVQKRLPTDRELGVDDLSDIIEVVPFASNDPRGSVTIAVSHKDPEVARTVAKTLAEVIAEQIKSDIQTEFDRVLADSAAAIENIRNDLSTAVTARQEALAAVSANPQVAPLITVEGGEITILSPTEVVASTEQLIQMEGLLTPYSLASARVSATLSAYTRVNAAFYEATVNKAKLSEPIVVLQAASLAKPKGHDLRLRDFFVIGAGGGLVLTWIVANFVDNFWQRRRPNDPHHGQPASPLPPHDTPPPAHGDPAAPGLVSSAGTQAQLFREIDRRLGEIRTQAAEGVKSEVVRTLDSRLEALAQSRQVGGASAADLERRIVEAASAAAERVSRRVMQELYERVPGPNRGEEHESDRYNPERSSRSSGFEAPETH